MHTDHMQSSIQGRIVASSPTDSAQLESVVRVDKFQSHDSDIEAPEELIESRFERAARTSGYGFVRRGHVSQRYLNLSAVVWPRQPSTETHQAAGEVSTYIFP